MSRDCVGTRLPFWKPPHMGMDWLGHTPDGGVVNCGGDTKAYTIKPERGSLGSVSPVSHTDGFKGASPGRGLLETRHVHN